jgi:AsmA protein
MKRIFKWTAFALLGLLIVAIAALLIIPGFIDVRHYKPWLEAAVRAATGRSFTVAGDVRLALIPACELSFAELRLGNPEGFAEEHFLSVRSVDVRLKLMPLLLRREVAVDHVVLRQPEVNLITAADGRVSWDFAAPRAKGGQAAPGGAAAEKSEPPALPVQALLIEELAIDAGRLALIDHRAGTRRVISDLKAALSDISLNRPVRVALAAAMDGKPLAVEGTVGPLFGQASAPVQLKVSAFGRVALRMAGALYDLPAAPRAEVEIDLGEFSLRRLLPEIGLPLPETADSGVLEKIAFQAAIKADAGSLRIDGGKLTLDDTQAAVAAVVRDFSRPNVAFDLALDRIDLDRYLPPQKAPAAGAAGGGAENQKPAGASRRGLELEGSVAAGRLKAARAVFEEVKLRITGRDGVFTVDPFGLRLYQGTAGGRAVFDLNGAAPQAEIRLAASGVQVHPLIQDLAGGKEVIAGTARADLDLAFAGSDRETVTRSLNGRGDLLLSDGAVIGVDLAGMVRDIQSTLTGKGGAGGERPRTDFSELKVPFTLRNGVFHTEQASLASPFLRLQAAGKADLARERLDFLVVPKLVGTLKGQGDAKTRAGIGVPVRVAGSFADPEFRPDLKAMAKEELKGLLAPESTGEKRPLREKAEGLLQGIRPQK